MDPLWSGTCWSTFKYFIILSVSTYIVHYLDNKVFNYLIRYLGTYKCISYSYPTWSISMPNFISYFKCCTIIVSEWKLNKIIKQSSYFIYHFKRKPLSIPKLGIFPKSIILPQTNLGWWSTDGRVASAWEFRASAMLLLLITGNYKLRYFSLFYWNNHHTILFVKNLLRILDAKMKDPHNHRQTVPSHISRCFPVRTDNTPKTVTTTYFYFIQPFQYVSLTRI
jgi:hypothetical protein